jgi:zinc transporter
MTDDDGLVYAYQLDGSGAGRALDWEGVRSWQAERGDLWVHLDRRVEASREWLRAGSGLDPVAVEALLAEETRPRSVAIGDGLMVILRGVNLNPGAEPEDMVSIRLWVDARRIISIRARRVMAVSDIKDRIEERRGPATAARFLVDLASRLVDRMGPVLDELDDEADDLENQILEGEEHAVRVRLRDIRRTAIALRRHLAPQREALSRLQGEEQPWIDAALRMRLREVADRVTHYVENLDELREHAAVIQDEIANRMSEKMNRNMYILSVVAAVMLPLGLITGLLGINVGGIPGADSPLGFATVCGILVALVVVEILLVKKLHLI